jgi:hypothetical protein
MKRLGLGKVADSQEFCKMVLPDMHLFPGILRKHLAAIGHKQSSEDIGPVLLHGLRLRCGL